MLQQPTAFKELPGVLAAFFQVAGLTGDNKIANIIGCTFTAYGERMINVMLSPFDLTSAVVALMLLPIVLLSYLLGRMCSWYSLFTCLTVAMTGSISLNISKGLLLYSLGIGGIVGSPIQALFFHMSFSVLCVTYLALRSQSIIGSFVSTKAFLCSGLQLLTRITFFISIRNNFDRVFRKPCVMADNTSAFLAHMSHTILTTLVRMEVFCGSRKDAFAFTALSHPLFNHRRLDIPRFVSHLSTAFSTDVDNPILVTSGSGVEKFRGSRLELIALRAAFLRYTGIHSKGHSLLSRPGVCRVPPGHTSFW